MAHIVRRCPQTLRCRPRWTAVTYCSSPVLLADASITCLRLTLWIGRATMESYLPQRRKDDHKKTESKYLSCKSRWTPQQTNRVGIVLKSP